MSSNGIVLSSAIRSNLITLQNTAEMQAKVQERLATGKKVNSALDNPSNFFTAAGLTRRASDLGALLDGMSNGIKTLEAADNSMKAITKSVETMQAYIRQARQDKSFKGQSITVDAASIGTATAKTISFAGGSVGATPVTVGLNTAEVGGTKTSQVTSAAYAAPAAAGKASLTGNVALNTGTFSQAVDVTIGFGGGSVDVSLANASNKSAAVASINAAIAGSSSLNGKVTASLDASNNLKLETVGNVDGAITIADKAGGAAGSATALMGTTTSVTGSDGQTNLTVGGTAVTLTTAESTVALAVTKANADLGSSSTVEAYDAGSSKLGFRNKAAGTGSFTLAGADASLFATQSAGTAPTTAGSVKTVDQLVAAINSNTALDGKVKASNDGGKLRVDNLSTESMTVTGVGSTSGQMDGSTGTATIGGNDVRKSLIAQFNEARNQLDKLAGDASYNGVNLLRADKLKVVFNESSTSTLDIQAKDTVGTVRGINVDTLGIVAPTSAEFSSDALLDDRLSQLSLALTTLQTQSSSFGANLTTVQTREDFTKSMINTLKGGADNLTLADANEEGANLLSLNTRQQLSQTALSLSSQASQAVLRLFG